MEAMIPATTTKSISEIAQAALWRSPLFSLRSVTVQEDNSRLQIRGRVATFYQKQQAQEIVRAAAKGVAIVNDIEVS